MSTSPLHRSLRLAGAVVVSGALCAGLLAVGAAGAVAAPAHATKSTERAGQRGSHPIPFQTATVTRNADGGYTIAWSAPGVARVAVYAGATQARVDYRRPVAVAGASGTVTVPASAVPAAGRAQDRQWFRLAPSRGEGLTLADRSLHLTSAPNFRDAGGYRTSDGSWVTMGVVYRSGDLSKLTAADLAELRRLGVHTVYDLRTDAERTSNPDQVPAGATDTQENILGTAGTGGFDATTAEAATQLMIQSEVTMVDAASAQSGYHDVLTSIAARKDLAVLYHCSAGKDRTGWASAALLTALGVPEQTVMNDYLASNTYNAATNAATLAQLPAASQAAYKPLLAVEPAYLNSGFHEVTAHYGSFAGYLRDGLHLDTAALQRLRADLLVG
jgi:protein-tyrosine phosphatase